MIVSYIETLAGLPWSAMSEDDLDLAEAWSPQDLRLIVVDVRRSLVDLAGLAQVDHSAHALCSQGLQLCGAGLAAGIQAGADFVEGRVFGQGRQ